MRARLPRSARTRLAAVVVLAAVAIVVPTSTATAATLTRSDGPGVRIEPASIGHATSTVARADDDPSTDGTASSGDGSPAAPAVATAEHVRSRLARFDEAEVRWDLGAAGEQPSAFVVQLIPASGAATTSETVDGRLRVAEFAHVASGTRFAVRVLVVDVDGVAKAPAVGDDLVTRSAVAAALDADAAATSAAEAAEHADRLADHAEAHARHLHGHARAHAVAAAAVARRHADVLDRRAIAAEDEAMRARHRIVHYDAA